MKNIFSDNEYTAKQNLIRNKYQIYNSKGQLVMKTKQKLFKLKEEFPFLDSDDKPLFKVKARQILDIAGDYALTDNKDNLIATLNKKFTFFHHIWKIKNPEGKIIATIKSRSLFLEVFRYISTIASLIPYKYSIEGPSGEKIGSIKEKFSIRDIYTVKVRENLDNSMKQVILAAAIAVDALEGE